ncbi:MAG: tRNA (adenosine(37)-N6)-dimethylallyltransferase MiaA, partial [Clostridia bacterium]|nr:tRNA (adenosine(37)-N6)-dimethylallyltransferase MiaA [Clostridia bacterium]
MKKKAVVIVGPTASGKTSLGVYVAKKFNGEVISADSMQIYKGMAISTAKPTAEEMDGVIHHLIDFVDITDKYSVSAYCSDARRCFNDITERGKLPVFVGGTGLYIDSFLTNT